MKKFNLINSQVSEIATKFSEGKSYHESLNPKINEYFLMLEPNWPEWLDDYIAAKELLCQKFISTTCGTIYSNLYNSKFFYSNLDHSVGVALIVWHFTHDKKQTLAGLFHDIATPAFKHCVDFMNGDYFTQESTEDLTHQIINNSKQIMKLLKRDKISIFEVDNYHLYPVADNNMPKLSADRLEYTLSNAIFPYELRSLEEIRRLYCDIEVQSNEAGESELGFKTPAVARDFVKTMCELSSIYICDKTRFSMQFIADILRKMSEDGTIKISDLYEKKEIEIVEIIKASKYGKVFEKWADATKFRTSKVKPKGKYCVKIGAKIRYIDPLCRGARMSKISKICSRRIAKVRGTKFDKFIYCDFDF